MNFLELGSGFRTDYRHDDDGGDSGDGGGECRQAMSKAFLPTCPCTSKQTPEIS